MPHKARVEFYYSKKDAAGNCYWSFRYTEIATGKDVVGTISGGESNLECMCRYMHPNSYGYTNHDELYCSKSIELKIRDYDKMVKDWPYAGCVPQDIAKFIKAALAKEVRAKCPHCGGVFFTKENPVGDFVTCGLDGCPKPNESWPILEEDQNVETSVSDSNAPKVRN